MPVVTRPSGIWAAGFQNVLDIDPKNPSILLGGGDLCGPVWTADRGLTWDHCSLGLHNIDASGAEIANAQEVACVKFSALDPIAFMGTGQAGYFAVGTYSGSSPPVWTVPNAAGDPIVHAGNTEGFPGLEGSGGGSKHPRNTGNLIALDELASRTPRRYIYVGSAGNGLYRTADDGLDWLLIAMKAPAGGGTGANEKAYIRTVCKDPNADVVYMGVHDQSVNRTPNATYFGAWKLTLASTRGVHAGSGPGPAVQLANHPGAVRIVEEIVAVSSTGVTTLYAACGAAGVYRIDNPNGTPVWTLLSNPVGKVGSIAAYRPAGAPANGSQDIVWFGTNDDSDFIGANKFQTIWRSMDGGTTPFEAISALATINTAVPTGEVWQFVVQGTAYRPSGGSYVCAAIRIDPSNPDNVYFAGRSGYWRTTNGRAPAAAVLLEPIVRGFNGSVGRRCQVDPYTAGRQAEVHETDVDWNHYPSTARGARFPDWTGSLLYKDPGTLSGHDMVFAPDGRAYLSGGGRGTAAAGNNVTGKIFTSPDPALVNWTALNGGAEVFGGPRAYGLAVGSDSDGVRLLVAAVDAGRIWRGRFTGGPGSTTPTWAQLSSGASAGAMSTAQTETGLCPIDWPGTKPGSVWVNPFNGTMYLFDRNATAGGGGVYRSTDFGLTWVKIRSHPSGYTPNRRTGHVKAHPFILGLVVVADKTGVYRATDAHTNPAPSWTRILDGTVNYAPAGIEFDPEGNLWILCRNGRAGEPARLLRFTDPLSGAAAPNPSLLPTPYWSDEGDEALRRLGFRVNWLSIAPDGQSLYATQVGAGMISMEIPVITIPPPTGEVGLSDRAFSFRSGFGLSAMRGGDTLRRGRAEVAFSFRSGFGLSAMRGDQGFRGAAVVGHALSNEGGRHDDDLDDTGRHDTVVGEE